MNIATVCRVAESVKTRRYRSAVREEHAAATRHAVLSAARELFTGRGYDATSVSEVARAAGVSVDTVYASVGRKPGLVLAVVYMVLGGADEPVPAEQRDYVRGRPSGVVLRGTCSCGHATGVPPLCEAPAGRLDEAAAREREVSAAGLARHTRKTR